MIRFLFFAVLNLFMLSTIKASTNLQFESSEHLAIGKEIELQYPSQKIVDGKLNLPNGLNLTYSEIIALGGDFFANPSKPISLAVSASDAKDRFLEAYDTLAVAPNALKEAPDILAVIYDEQKQIENALQNGEIPVYVYQKMATDHNVAWNCITGGLCKSATVSETLLRKIYFLYQGRYLKICDHNFDHFGQSAWDTYAIGHAIALETAHQGYLTHDLTKLNEAYAINAFACHYLSDGFSSGHMRTPRWLLFSKVTPGTVGSLLADYMHNEDDEVGLIVSNANGQTWRAFGDRFYFDPRNAQNRLILKAALQASADEIFEAYTKNEYSPADKVLGFFPNLEKLDQEKNTQINSSPMFYWDPENKKLMRRYDINNSSNYQWTAYWFGWSSLTALLISKGIPAESQAILLAHQDTHDESIQKGLITDKTLLKFALKDK